MRPKTNWRHRIFRFGFAKRVAVVTLRVGRNRCDIHNFGQRPFGDAVVDPVIRKRNFLNFRPQLCTLNARLFAGNGRTTLTSGSFQRSIRSSNVATQSTTRARLDFSYAMHFHTEEAMNHHQTTRPMEIVLIEDSLTFAHVTISALRHAQVEHRLTWLTNGEDALEFLYKQGKFARAPRPDLILLDLSLPKVDGRRVLTDIKSDYELNSIPVVVLTGSMDDEDRVRSQCLDVEGYMVKPVDLEKFLTLVRELNSYWLDDVILPQVCALPD